MANLPFTREQLIALGFDPDKAVEVMKSDQPADQIPHSPSLNMEPTIPYRRGFIPAEAEKALATPVESKPAIKPRPMETQSLQDKQADAMAALEVMGEQEKAATPAPLPAIAQNIQPPEAASPKEDMLTRYMNMMDQIKRDEKAGLETGKKDLDKARLIDGLLNASSTIGEAFSRGRGGDLRAKDLYTEQPRLNAEKDYAELIRQFKQQKDDVGGDLGNLSSMQKVRSGESDFTSSEQFRDPSSEVSQLYRNQYKKLNPDVPISDNLSAEAVSKLITASKKPGSTELTPYQSAMLEIYNKKMGQADQRINLAKDTQARLMDQFLHGKQQKDELSDKQTESIASFDKVLNFSNTLGDKFKKVQTKLGPYASKAENFKDMVPYLEKDPEFVAFQADVTDTLSQYIKALSGLTVSDRERAMLEQSAPKITDKPGEFLSKLSAFQKRLQEFKGTELEAYRKYQGKNIQGYGSEQTDPRIDNFMKKNGITNRNQAIEILKRAGKI